MQLVRFVFFSQRLDAHIIITIVNIYGLDHLHQQWNKGNKVRTASNLKEASFMIQLDVAPNKLLAQTFRGLSYLSRFVHTFRFLHLILTKFTDVKVPPDHGALELTAWSKNMNTYSKDCCHGANFFIYFQV